MTHASTANEASEPLRTSGPWGGLTWGLLLGAVSLGAWQACAATHARRQAHRSTAAPATVQNWENEGGAPDPCEG